MKKVLSIFITCILFIGSVFAQTITVTSPNGGEVWAGCTTHNITWSTSGTLSGSYSIDYSSNGGTTWTSLASYYSTASGTFAWLVPNVASTNALVRVYDSYFPTRRDSSNNTFTMTAPLLVSAPNGGETWQATTTKTISWVLNGTSNYFNIEYSTNAGISWTPIATNYYSTIGTYTWTVPNTPSTSCMVRVADYNNTSCKIDQSDGLFTISPPTPVLTVTSPNGGETWYGGTINSVYTISWTCAYLSGANVKLEYSTNNGSSWLTIVASTSTGATSGSYNWTVPGTFSNQCLVKVTDVGNTSTNDVSNAVFTIAPPSLVLTSPNGGENWPGCSTKTISWNKTGNLSNSYTIDYSTNGGSTWISVASFYSTTGSTYSWTVPFVTSTNCLVRVYDSYYPSYRDSNNAIFTISAPVTVTAPNGGESWQVGQTKNITWVPNGTSTYVTLEYSINGGTSWTTIISQTSATSGTYSWVIPNTPSTNCLVRVKDYSNSCMIDQSDAVFTIAPGTPIITVTSPNGGETWYGGYTYNTRNITWTCQYLSGVNVKIEYSTNNGSSWTTIIASTPTGTTSGSYLWTVPSTYSNQCLVKVSDASNTTTNDISNAVFIIASPSLTVIAPNGGEVGYYVCDATTIQWTPLGCSNSYKIEYTINNGTNWTTITNSASGSSYTWTFPSTAATTYKVRVTDNTATVATDASDAVFTISNPITLTSPNGGESWQVGTTKQITWVVNPNGAAGNYVTLQYSTDNGTNWNTIVSQVAASTGTYNWVIPNVPSTNCVVRVYDYNTNCKIDQSNAVFTITPGTPIITVTSPNGGETWYGGYTYNTRNITWTCQYLTSTYVKIEYSTDNGATWATIIASTSTGATGGSYLWTVPATYSNQCLVRVSEFGTPTTNDISNAVFTIAPPSLTLTTPNGGETGYYVCDGTNIQWSPLGCSNSYKIEYTTNGTTWTTITNSTSGSIYYWTFPATVATTYKVRVTDNTATVATDVSDAVFTISNPIILTSPNGGESWQVGTTKQITWVVSPNGAAGTYVTLEYSTNNGTSWNTIISQVAAATGTYNWTVPNAPSTNCLVRVKDYNTNCKIDQSDAVFTITPGTPTITLTSPNGGETWYGGYTYHTRTISWTCQYLSGSNVKIEYSTDNGSTWTTIISSTPTGITSGSYTWAVPGTYTNQCLVRVSDATNTSTNDVSNGVFTIAPPSLTVTAPNGGETGYYVCNTTTIQWVPIGCSNSYKIEYTTNNGTNWTTITNNTSGSSYTWTMPAIATTTYKVRVSDNTATVAKDTSDAVFAIANPVTVTSPNGGETWQVGSTKQITWVVNPTGAAGTSVTIEYSTNNGTSWNTIVSQVAASTGTYNWVIPNIPSTNCLVRVYDYNTNCKIDQSNAVFTISAGTPIITVTSPNGGETVYGGYAYNTRTISWTNQYLTSGFVKIEYSTDNGSTWIMIVASTATGASNGSYTWTVPGTYSNQCLVRVSEYANAGVNDVSNAVFTIAPPSLTVTTPNGGEAGYYVCDATTIQWTPLGCSNSYKIEYTINNGTNWTTITNSASGSSYYWTFPSTASTTYKVRVTDNTATVATDVSDAVFAISNPITLTSPNGGESWQVASTKQITWVVNPTNAAGNYVTLEYSTNNGTNWTTIVSQISAASGTYNWTIPNTPSNNCLVRVKDYNTNCKIDQSDAVFTISPGTPAITITGVLGSGNTTIYGGYSFHSKVISWTCQYLSGSNVKIEYSIDNGTTWITIIASTPTGTTSGSYTWTPIPGIYSNQCLIRISDAITSSTNDVSDAVFTIAPPSLAITYPNGGESLIGCDYYYITWSHVGCSGIFKLEYSSNGGSSWTTIANNLTVPNYGWTVPSIASTTYLVRVSDYLEPAITDQSNTIFTVLAPVTVTSPNGGESWRVGTTQQITWVAPSGSLGSLVSIQYSTNNGTSWNTIVSSTSASTGTYTWTVPNVPSTNCLIKVTDYYDGCTYDVSNAVFTITPGTPVITVVSPNGGNTLYGNSNATITWTSAYLGSSFVKIEYSTNGGSTWTTVISSVSNTGSYSWAVPPTYSNQCLVRVSDFGNTTTNDISDAVFTIAPPITITSPNGGEDLGACTATTLLWTAGGTSNYYTIEYSTNGGTNWITVITNYYSAGPNCSYNWTVPHAPSTNCLVRIKDYNDATRIDQSNTTFTITPAITVTQPNFNGNLVVGSTYTIKWNTVGASNYYNIDYSTNGGATWTNIVSLYNTVTNTYSWTVPNAPSTNCVVRVTDFYNTCKVDQSDLTFTITATAPAITITAPNGGENWSACGTQNITWTATGTSGTYNIDYSTNGGGTWTSIVTNYTTGSNTYAWTLPNVNASAAIVRVTDTSAPTKTDNSDAGFVLLAPVANAGADVTICAGNSTTLSGTGNGGTIYRWRPAAGLSDTTILNPVATPSATTSYTLVVKNANGCTSSDVVVVTVNNYPTLTASAVNSSICVGSSTVINASGATTYTWSPATGLNNIYAASPIASPTTSTTYTVTGYNGNCSSTVTVAITVNTLPATPTITATGPTAFCAGGSVLLTSSAGTGYSWSIGGATTQSITATTSGNYTVTVSNAAGCTATSVAKTVTVNALPTPTITASGPTTFCSGSNVVLTSSSSTNNTWNPGGAISQSITVTTAGSYTVTVVDANGCSGTSASKTITVNPAPTIVATAAPYVICAGSSTTLTASGGSGYTWSPPTGLSSTTGATVTANPTITTTYTVTESVSGCSKMDTVLVTVNPIPSLTTSANATICAGASTNLSVSGASSYKWSPGASLSDSTSATPVATPTATTTYTVTGKTAGCSATKTVTITVNPIPNVTVSNSGTICAGDTTTLTASGAAAYSWTPSGGLNNTTGAIVKAHLTSGVTYTVTGTTSGCSATATTTVVVNALPTVSASNNGPKCAGDVITLSATGASSFVWNTTQTGTPLVVTPLTTTTYTVTGTDANGCKNTATTIAVINPLPNANAGNDLVVCTGNTVTLNATGGGTYLWSPGATLSDSSIANPVASPTVNTTYIVTVTSTNGCKDKDTLNVAVQPSLIAAAGNTASICLGSSTQLNATGGITYSWSPATGLSSTTIANPVATPTATTLYTVTVASAGCANATDTVRVIVKPIPTISATNSTICAGTSGLITTTVSPIGGTYLWSTTETTASITVTPTITTNYTVDYTLNGCTKNATATITVVPLPTTPTITQNGNNLVSSATAGNQWYLNNVIINGATSQTYTPTQSGSYIVAVTACSTTVTSTAFNFVVNNYCTPVHSANCTSINNINTVSITGTTLNNANTGCNSITAQGYTLWPASGSTTTNLTIGTTYSLSVTTTGTRSVSSWIDYNGNGVFEASEYTLVTSSSSSGVATTVNVSIPSTATVGVTRMRIRCRATGSANGPNDACTSFGSGSESEDYIVTLKNSTMPPVADFTASTISIPIGGIVDFTDNSLNTPITWSWIFNGATPATSNLQNPTGITYATSGCYDVTLIVSNTNGSDTLTKTCYINVAAPNYCLPTYSTGTGDGDYIDGVVLGTITNLSSGSATGPDYNDYTSQSTLLNVGANYSINITSGTYATDYYAAWIDYNGDGDFMDANEKLGEIHTTSASQTLGLNFTVPSSATVIGATRLRVRCVFQGNSIDPCIEYGYGETEDYTVILQSGSAVPIANFTTSNTSVCAGSSVSFTDQTANIPTSWHWTFIGGTPSSSTLQNPTVIYSTAGTYSVTLIATNGNGSDTITKNSYITVNSLPNTPTITANGPTSFCPGGSVVLTSSTGISYSWSPGNATTQSITVNSAGSYTVTVKNASGCSASSAATVVTVNTATALPLTQNFEGAFVPAGWSLGNSDNDKTWEQSGAASGFGIGSASAKMNNYGYNATGQSDYLYTPLLSLSGATAPTLKFDVAYARYDATHKDSLEVYVSNNCGATWSRVYSKSDTVLATAPDATSSFVPTATQWRTETISLNSYIGSSAIQVAFRNRTGYGNDLYIDNVNLTAINAVTANFNVASTTVCVGQAVVFNDLSTGYPTQWSWTFNGGTPSSSSLQNPSIVYNTPGTYSVTLVASKAGSSNTVTKTSYITVVAKPAIPTITQNGLTLTASTAPFYQWFLNGNIISGATSQTYIPLQNGNYTLQAINSAGCSSTSAPYNYSITSIVTVSVDLHSVNVYPNPTQDLITLEINNIKAGEAIITVTNLIGEVVQAVEVSQNGSFTKQLDLSSLANGTYFVNVTTDKLVAVKRVVKN